MSRWWHLTKSNTQINSRTYIVCVCLTETVSRPRKQQAEPQYDGRVVRKQKIIGEERRGARYQRGDWLQRQQQVRLTWIIFSFPSLLLCVSLLDCRLVDFLQLQLLYMQVKKEGKDNKFSPRPWTPPCSAQSEKDAQRPAYVHVHPGIVFSGVYDRSDDDSEQAALRFYNRFPAQIIFAPEYKDALSE